MAKTHIISVNETDSVPQSHVWHVEFGVKKLDEIMKEDLIVTNKIILDSICTINQRGTKITNSQNLEDQGLVWINFFILLIYIF